MRARRYQREMVLHRGKCQSHLDPSKTCEFETTFLTDEMAKGGVGVGEQPVDGHVAQVTVDANAFWRSHHEVGGGGSLLFGAVLGIGADMNDFPGIAHLIDDLVALVEQIVHVTENRAEVLAGGDGSPAD